MRYWLALTLGLFMVGLPAGTGYAQSPTPSMTDQPDLSTVDPIFLLWSRNIARRAAEAENGGIGNYIAEASMHGPTTQAPITLNDDGSLTFIFKGYRPGDFSGSGEPNYTIETEVLVNPDRTFEVVYNGPIREVTP